MSDRGSALRVWGVGVDVVEIGRFEAAIGRRARMLERLFDAEEVAYAGEGPNRWERLAARFAAKEAIVKAAGGFRGSGWREIVVGGRVLRPPTVSVRGPLGEWLRERGLEVRLSLAHERTVAVAVAMLAEGGGTEAPEERAADD